MKLKRMELKNFKGIKHLVIEFLGNDVNIYGDNGLGKTTILDAFTWVMYGKDSQNKADFAIKTLDKNNQPIHGLEHEVNVDLDINGSHLSLRKVYKEMWTKKRGTAKAEFTGHTTDYFIDDVPVKKKEYDEHIESIANEKLFKLLSLPTYFNTQYSWQQRREEVIKVCGDISDEEVIASDKALSKLPEILNGRSLEDHKKVIAAKRAAINKELEKIPVRIDEVEQGLPDLTGLVVEEIAAEIESLRAQIKEKEVEVSRIESGSQVTKKQNELRVIEGELIALKNELQGQISEKIDAKRAELQQTKFELTNYQIDLNNKKGEQEHIQKQIEKLEAQREELREKWYQVNDQQFSFEQSDTCPTCGQALPVERLTSAREKALADYNQKKAEKLETITANGKEASGKVAAYRVQYDALDEEIKQAGLLVAETSKKANSFEMLIENMMKDSEAYKEDPAYIRKLRETGALEEEIKQLQQDNTEAIGAVKKEIEQLNGNLLTLQTSLARVDQYEKGQKRIEELKAQERDLAAEYERLEGELYLTEEFVKAKVNMLEEKINSKFELARFKLFNTLVNGGVEECCETLYQGVPYSSGLNNGARINVGLDIINTLSNHYGFSAPIFIDNAEAVTELISTRGQVIRLIVSEKDKALRVEPDEAQNVLFKEVV